MPDNQELDRPRSLAGDGQPIHPGEGSFPILQELEPRKLAVVGTGFWISRYGLFLTARHVVEELMKADGTLGVAYTMQLAEDDRIYCRPIRRVTFHGQADLAVGQAENYMDRVPQAPIMNRLATLTTTVPSVGSRLVTYAYPENAILDFTDEATKPVIRGDFFQGMLLRNVEKSEHPFIPYPYLETSIEVRSGASGGPVFDEQGRVVAVNCRGWDFRGAEEEGNNLSSAVPIGEIMPMEVPLLQLPPGSWEAKQVPAVRRGKPLVLSELAAYGHLRFTL